MKKLQLKKSLLQIWLISYLLVLIVPLVMSQILYQASYRALEENAASLSQSALSQTVSAMDRVAQEVQSLGRELLARQEVESLLYASTPLSAFKLEKAGLLRNEMLTRAAYSACVTDVYLIFSRPGLVVSTRGYYDSLDVFDQMLKREFTCSLEQLESWTNHTGTLQFKMLGNTSEANQVLAHMTDSPSISVSEVTVLFVLDIELLRSVMENRDGKDEGLQFWAVSPSGRILAPANASQTAMQVDTEDDVGETMQYQNVNGERIAVLQMSSLQTGWRFFSAVLLTEYTAQLQQVRNWYLLYLAVCIALGVGFSLYFAWCQYKPVRRLFQMLGHDGPDTQEGQEYAQLEAGLTSLLRKSQGYEREIDRQKARLRQDSLVRMLMGSLHSDQAFQAACADYDLHFSTSQFGVIGIELRDYSNLFLEGHADESEETLELAGYVVTSVTEELLREFCDGYVCSLEGSLYAILSPRELVPAEEMEKFLERIREICLKAETFLRERMGICVSFYISGLQTGRKSGMTGIHQAFQETVWGMEQMEGFRLEMPAAVRQDLLPLVGESGENLPVSMSDSAIRRRQFCAAALAGDLDQVDQLYLELRTSGLAQMDRSFSSIRLQTMFLLDYLVSNLDQPPCQPEDTARLEELIEGIRAARHTGQLAGLIHEAAELVHSLHSRTTDREEESLCVRVCRYINDHYQDPNISVASIADQFGISQSYLLRQFKRGVNGGVLDYIHQRRVDTAKLLLRESDDTIEHIATAVGYSNSLALIRAFKRLEGTTPTAWRRVMNP